MEEQEWAGWEIDTKAHKVRDPTGAVVFQGLDWEQSVTVGGVGPSDFAWNGSLTRVYNLPDGHYLGVWWNGTRSRWELVTLGDCTFSRRLDPSGALVFVPDAAPALAATFNLVGHPGATAAATVLRKVDVTRRVLPLLDKSCSYLFVVSGPGLRTLPLTVADAWGDEGNLSNGLYHIATRRVADWSEVPEVPVGLQQPLIRYLTSRDEFRDSANIPCLGCIGLTAQETQPHGESGALRRIILHCPFWASVAIMIRSPEPAGAWNKHDVLAAAIDVILTDEVAHVESKKDLSGLLGPLLTAVRDGLEALTEARFGHLPPADRPDAEGDYLENTALPIIVQDLLRVVPIPK